MQSNITNWLLLFLIPFMILPVESDTTVFDCKKLIRDLRNNWESPLAYLKSRGYIPKGTNEIYEEKLKALEKEEEPLDQLPLDDTSNFYEFEKHLPIRENSLKMSDTMTPLPIAAPHNQHAEVVAQNETEAGLMKRIKEKLLSFFTKNTAVKEAPDKGNSKPALEPALEFDFTSDIEGAIKLNDFNREKQSFEKDRKYIKEILNDAQSNSLKA